MLDLQDPKFNRLGNVSTLKRLVELIKKNKVIPFVGAGMSVDIYGSWGAALKRIMNDHLFGPPAQEVQTLIDSGRYEEAADKISCLLGETTFYDQLVDVFGEQAITDERLKKMPVRYLPRIFKDSLVVTTNFDKVLERTFLMEQYSFAEKVVLRHLTGWQADGSKHGILHYLIKIHGCVSAPDEVVMTKESYDELYQKNSPHIARLRGILGGNKLLFIGCSLNTDRTVDLLREVGHGDHYAILAMNSEAEAAAFQERRLFMSNELKMHCIWYPKGERHYVADILEYIYADITGQLGAVASVAPEVPIEAVESVALEEPLEGRIPAPVKTAQLAKTPKSAAKQPLVKNEIHTMGRWQDKPLEWLVLDVQPDRALLIARDCLLQAPYNEEQKTVTWKQCTLRKNLLPQLLTQIFDATEQNNVLSSNNRNPDNENYGTPGGADTEDKLFLLSIDEVKKYFPYDEARVAHLNGKAVFWWLRSPGFSSYLAAFVSTGGLVSGNGYLVSWSEGSVRPAFWLNRQS